MTRPRGSIHVDRTLPADKLREVLKPVIDKLLKAGVPEERLPTNEAILSHLLDWVDDDKIDEWVEKFAELEAE